MRKWWNQKTATRLYRRNSDAGALPFLSTAWDQAPAETGLRLSSKKISKD
jgi:hypothetical protein